MHLVNDSSVVAEDGGDSVWCRLKKEFRVTTTFLNLIEEVADMELLGFPTENYIREHMEWS